MADADREDMPGYSHYFGRNNSPVIHERVEVEGQFADVEDTVPEVEAEVEDLVIVDDENDGGDERECDDSEDDGYEEDDFEFWNERAGPNSQASQAAQKNFQTSDELFRKFSSKISVEKYEGVNSLPTGVGNKILSSSKRAMSQGMKVKDKQDRATVEQVLDPRTRMIIYKLLSSGKIVSIDGCISTGKEANVYYATGPEETALAIKIFKTSILTFKARDKYVSGEFRFRQGYCKKNPRKMVRLWAEKEYRNLLRIHTCGTIKVPQPHILKSHVLVMDFIGEDGWPSPLLKDVKFGDIVFSEGQENSEMCDDNDQQKPEQDDPVLKLITDLYRQCLVILYRLFKHCKLVHADFSEFNLILKSDKDLFVIDVSQSVEHDHPRSFDFLRKDIKNVQDFFGKYILVGDYKEIFEFITSPNVDDSNYEAVLESILKKAKRIESFNVGDEVFRQTHIPRKMQEVVDYERDYEKMKHGETELVYTKVMGMKPDMSGPDMTVPSLNSDLPNQVVNGGAVDKIYVKEVEPGRYERVSGPSAAAAKKTEESSSTESDSESEDSDEVEDGENTCKPVRSKSEKLKDDDKDGEKKNTLTRPDNETLEEKRLRKKQVKEDKAEKRKNKVKKHVKKRKEKLAHANSKR